MKKYFTFFILFIAAVNIYAAAVSEPGNDKGASSQDSVYGSVTVKRWADNKKSAFTISFDDSTISQFTNARPVLDKYGLKATFFVITGEVTDAIPNWEYGFWWQFDSLAHEGHEIGAHTVTHPDLDTCIVGSTTLPGSISYELYQSQQTIEKKIPGYKCISLAYPYCSYDNDVIRVASRYFQAARKCGDYSNSANIRGDNFYKVQAIDIYFNHPRGVVTDDQAFDIYTQNVVAQSINTGGWANYYAHDLLPLNLMPDTTGADTTVVSTYFLDKLCNWVVQQSDSGNIWEATFGNVTRYIKERENFNFDIVSSSSNQIILSTSIGSLDTSIFNYPLTVDITVPQSWKDVAVTQGNRFSTDSSFFNGINYVVRVNIIPGAENIVLSSGTSYSVSGHVYYDNSQNTPVKGISVIISSPNGTDSTLTDSSGEYNFDNISPGEYAINLSKYNGWGSVNSTDALVVAKYFARQILLDNMQKKAADVNNSGQINSTDALMICKRFLNYINKFSIPNWMFSGPTTIIVSDKNISQDFKAIAAGDVNKSLIP